jgi:hypothetical protein
VNITITVPRKGREGTKNWKEPFKKLKLSKICAEDEWKILLHVHGKDAKKVHKLTAGLRVETVMDKIGEGQEFLDQETWEDKFGPSVAEGEGA